MPPYPPRRDGGLVAGGFGNPPAVSILIEERGPAQQLINLPQRFLRGAKIGVGLPGPNERHAGAGRYRGDRAAHRGRRQAAQPLHRRCPEFLVPGVSRAAAADHDQGRGDEAVYGLSQMLLRIAREQSPSHICVVFDAPGEKLPHPGLRGVQGPPSADAGRACDSVALVARVVDAFGIQTLAVPGFEADDVIATVTRLAVADGMEVVICSSDKDLMQLCDENVTVLDTMKNRRMGPAEVKEKFGVSPAQVGDVLALMGDSIDNVPGVDGIGPKTAAELISKFGSLDGLYAPPRRGQRQARRETLATAREAVRSRASWWRSATTCRYRRPWPSSTASSPTATSCWRCFASSSSRASSRP